MRYRALLVLACLSVAGCALWVATGGRYVDEAQGLSIDLPQGWMRRNNLPEGLFLTRDGVTLEFVSVWRAKVDADVPNTKKKFAEDMLPEDAASVQIDATRSDPTVTNFSVQENSPATIDGHPGFKLVYAYRLNSELKVRTAIYGCIIGDWIYRFSFQAADQYYFDRYRDAFESTVASVKFAKAR